LVLISLQIMIEIILYPTETIYGLGVNALDEEALRELYELKGRSKDKAVSWLVRDILDIEKYAELSVKAAKIAKQFLPGPLTLVLPIKKAVHGEYPFLPENIGFRISSDLITQKLISDYMKEDDTPLTCTSANLSGSQTECNVPAILNQFSTVKEKITKVIDDGPRGRKSSTVISVIGSGVIVLREGAVLEMDIREIV
jgi:L-threonylcarbamoyladenylate synthase